MNPAAGLPRRQLATVPKRLRICERGSVDRTGAEGRQCDDPTHATGRVRSSGITAFLLRNFDRTEPLPEGYRRRFIRMRDVEVFVGGDSGLSSAQVTSWLGPFCNQIWWTYGPTIVDGQRSPTTLWMRVVPCFARIGEWVPILRAFLLSTI
jgi:hypothetical protein